MQEKYDTKNIGKGIIYAPLLNLLNTNMSFYRFF